MTGGTVITASGRTLEEMKAGIRIRMRNMVNSALEIGIDLMEAKDACRHGEWMPFLRDIGLSASTAANYMRIAKEVSADSALAGLPYTKILALLTAPPEEREELAAAAGDMSAAEIRRLTEERNRAAEAANTETARADRAEKDAKMYNQEAANLRKEIQILEARLEFVQSDSIKKSEYTDYLEKALEEKEEEMQRLLRECDEEAREEEREKIQAEIDNLHEKLKTATGHEIRVEVAPADYEQLKQDQADLIAAAAEAEQRAADAEAELEALRAGDMDDGREDAWKVLKVAMVRFLNDCEMMPLDPQALIPYRPRINASLARLEGWIRQMRSAMDGAVTAEAVVV